MTEGQAVIAKRILGTSVIRLTNEFGTTPQGASLRQHDDDRRRHSARQSDAQPGGGDGASSSASWISLGRGGAIASLVMITDLVPGG